MGLIPHGPMKRRGLAGSFPPGATNCGHWPGSVRGRSDTLDASCFPLSLRRGGLPLPHVGGPCIRVRPVGRPSPEGPASPGESASRPRPPPWTQRTCESGFPVTRVAQRGVRGSLPSPPVRIRNCRVPELDCLGPRGGHPLVDRPAASPPSGSAAISAPRAVIPLEQYFRPPLPGTASWASTPSVPRGVLWAAPCRRTASIRSRSSTSGWTTAAPSGRRTARCSTS